MISRNFKMNIYGSVNRPNKTNKSYCLISQISQLRERIYERKIKVLLLDSSVNMLEFLKNEIEEDQDIKVIGMARDEHEARNLTIGLEPDLLIMDILSPCSGGIKFLKRLNRFCPRPVIILSPLRKMNFRLIMSVFEEGVTSVIDKDTLIFKETL